MEEPLLFARRPVFVFVFLLLPLGNIIGIRF